MNDFMKVWYLGPPATDGRDLTCSVVTSVYVGWGQFGLDVSWNRDSTGLRLETMIGPVELDWSGPPVGRDRDEPSQGKTWHVAGRRIELFRIRRHLGVKVKWYRPDGYFRIDFFAVGICTYREPT